MSNLAHPFRERDFFERKINRIFIKMETSSEYFLSSLSHQIRTPLNGIIGYSQLLSQTKLDKIQVGYIRDMNSCSLQLLSLINDILDFSKLSVGKVSIKNECFRLKEMFDDIGTVISSKLLEKQIKIKFILEDNVSPLIISDKGKITQILINLLTNAIKFSPIMSRILVNCLQETRDNKNFLVFSVEDNGIGISKENQKMLFNPFVQVNESVTKNGSGLGLSICKKLTELLGGEISVESSVNRGSIFTFSVAIEIESEFFKSLSKNLSILTEKNILLCDDDIDKRLILSEILYEQKIPCDVCSTEKELIKMVKRKRYDCVIFDTMFGKTEIFNTIKETNENMKIIGLSKIEITNYGFSRIFIGTERTTFLSVLYSMFARENEQLIELNVAEKVIPSTDTNTTPISPRGEPLREKTSQMERKIPSILIAEDIEYNMEILTKMLENLGYIDITKATNGQEAIECLNKKKFDILFLDLKMPIMNGFDVAEFIRNRKMDIKIAVLSASVLDKDRDKCKDLGILYFLLKPFNLNNIRVLMRNFTKIN